MRRDIKRVISLCTALAMAAPYAAYAADPPAAEPAAQDVLFKNGAKARGQVVDIVPGDHVTIKLKSGEMRRFEWKDVDRVVPASGAEPPPLPPAVNAPAQTAAPTASAPPAVTIAPTATAPNTNVLPPVSGPTARVHINSPEPAALYRKAAGMTSFQKVCDAPCDQEMPLSDDYQVSGSGLGAVDFKLNAQPGQTVVIECSPSSTGGKVGGIVMMVVGGVVLVFIGLPGTLIALALQSSTTTDSNTKSDWMRDTLIIDLVGVGIAAGGLVLLLKSRDGGAQQHLGFLNGIPDPTKVDDRFVRTPMWRVPTNTEKQANGPAPVMFPLFSHAF
jgi:hypothetical protein